MNKALNNWCTNTSNWILPGNMKNDGKFYLANRSDFLVWQVGPPRRFKADNRKFLLSPCLLNLCSLRSRAFGFRCELIMSFRLIFQWQNFFVDNCFWQCDQLKVCDLGQQFQYSVISTKNYLHIFGNIVIKKCNFISLQLNISILQTEWLPLAQKTSHFCMNFSILNKSEVQIWFHWSNRYSAFFKALEEEFGIPCLFQNSAQ